MSEQVQATQQTTAPNQYHLQGGGIHVAYYPEGAGPIVEGKGPIVLTYQDAVRSLSFGKDQVRVNNAATDVGSIVSVTIAETPDFGSTTFSLVVPPVILPSEPFGHAAIETIGITTLHRSPIWSIGLPQRAFYTITNLTGAASNGILPK